MPEGHSEYRKVHVTIPRRLESAIVLIVGSFLDKFLYVGQLWYVVTFEILIEQVTKKLKVIFWFAISNR
jgi:hypothetical protein